MSVNNIDIESRGGMDDSSLAGAAEAFDKLAAASEAGVMHHESRDLVELKRRDQELKRQADALAKLAGDLETIHGRLTEEAGQMDRENAIRTKAFPLKIDGDRAMDPVPSQTGAVDRFKAPSGKRNLTGGEAQELPDRAGRFSEETGGLLNAAHAALDRAGHGQGSKSEIHALLQRVIGHHYAQVQETEASRQVIEQLKRQMEDVERILQRSPSVNQ